MDKTETPWAKTVCFALSILIGAFLVFQVQPILSKAILPWFGGTPAVWTTCMLFFQCVLFGGYVYSHLLTRFCSPKWQGGIHLLLVIAAMFSLPIVPHESWKPVATESPTFRIISLLLVSIGLPYFVLSATGPLMQVWFSKTMPDRSPYRLFALSNFGSLVALLSYPLVFEPKFSINSQATIWAIAFVFYAFACGACVVQLWNAQSITEGTKDLDETAVQPNLRTYAVWLMLPAFASVALLASTNHVCQNVSVTPFLWVLPLSLYLVTFIICFDNPRWYSRTVCAIGALIALVLTGLQTKEWFPKHIVLDVATYFAAMFFLCMLCHGEFVRRKPHPKYLTSFYLCCSGGGAMGGIFVGLICPMIFKSYFEMSLTLLIGYGIGAGVLAVVVRRIENPITQIGIGTAAFVGLIIVFSAHFQNDSAGVLEVRRSFYGVLTVRERDDPQTSTQQCAMFHGSIVHGLQFMSPDLRQRPTTYYHARSGVGLALEWLKQNYSRSIRVGIVGLGTGTLAVYARKDDDYRYYEINPDVVAMARGYFSFLNDSPGRHEIVLGDARLSLERESAQAFDLLVLDAFSGDGIPAHLLTREAGDIYLRHLHAGGVIAVHITNLHLDLVPVVLGLARHMNLECREVFVEGMKTDGNFTSHWMILSNNQALINSSREFEPIESKTLLWTDAHNNLLEILKSQKRAGGE